MVVGKKQRAQYVRMLRTARARREDARDGMSKASLEIGRVLRGDQVLRQAATYTLGCPKGRLRKLKPKTKRRAEAPSPVQVPVDVFFTSCALHEKLHALPHAIKGLETGKKKNVQ